MRSASSSASRAGGGETGGDGAEAAEVSYPNFWETLRSLSRNG